MYNNILFFKSINTQRHWYIFPWFIRPLSFHSIWPLLSFNIILCSNVPQTQFPQLNASHGMAIYLLYKIYFSSAEKGGFSLVMKCPDMLIKFLNSSFWASSLALYCKDNLWGVVVRWWDGEIWSCYYPPDSPCDQV